MTNTWSVHKQIQRTYKENIFFFFEAQKKIYCIYLYKAIKNLNDTIRLS